MKKGLFARYFSLCAWIILVSVAALGVIMVAISANYFNEDRLDMLSRKATQAVEMVVGYHGPNGRVDFNKIRSDFSILARAMDADLFLTDPSGKILMQSDSVEGNYTGYLIPEEFVRDALAGEYRGSGRLPGILEESTYLIARTVWLDGFPGYIVVAAQPASAMIVFLSEMAWMFLIGAALIILLAFFAVYFSTETLVLPLRRMVNATASFAKGDFSARIPVEGDEEIRQLALAFNRMASALADLEATRRSFIANVSHELRTPMTTIGGFIDGILDGTIPDERAPYYLRIVSQEVGRLSRMVVSMLNISRIEAGELNLRPQAVDLHEIVCRTFLIFEQMIEQKSIELKGLDTDKVFVEADPDMLQQICYNLIENAVKFTPEEGIIEVAYQNSGKTVTTTLRNSGMGIHKEDLAHLFERFYKSDRSRSRDTRGAGLGLHIARSLVHLHNGTISVSSVEGEYSEFFFTLPSALPRGGPHFRKA